MAFVIPFDRATHVPVVVDRATPQRPGLLRRWLQALMAAQQRRADREIARYIATSGFTDASEREIERRFLFDGRR